MRVGVGYCDNPDSISAGRRAVAEAMIMARRDAPCDLILLFTTSNHDTRLLTRVIHETTRSDAPIVGGGAIGAITNTSFGYAGDQVCVALIWYENVISRVLAEPGLRKDEAATGYRLGQRMADLQVDEETPVLLLYDAVDRTGGDMRLLMATPLLAGIRDGLGWFPNLVGAGLQGDYAATPVQQWNGTGLTSHEAVAVVFNYGLQIDSAIMHGCRPATSYYTVTKADQQVVLEIDGVPALPFIQNLLGSSIDPDTYPFFLTFGINKGEEWGEFNEPDYANRLCLALDRKRNGIVMFEPDMAEGTRFQLMHRSLDLDYMEPKIRGLFDNLGDRRPVFALYINCAGRAAGYSGTDLEDAETVQRLVGDVPLLGIYSGVEIAPVAGEPRALDWTGVFCLCSVPNA